MIAEDEVGIAYTEDTYNPKLSSSIAAIFERAVQNHGAKKIVTVDMAPTYNQRGGDEGLKLKGKLATYTIAIFDKDDRDGQDRFKLSLQNEVRQIGSGLRNHHIETMQLA